ncbi:MAG: hypothetical protein ACWGO2_09775 [Syntrophobacteria bacterium]|jgi:hypothetical protein
MANNISELKRALELDRDGDWDSAHRIVQGIESSDSYWIHAYLHRKEGALGNSNYWYRRAKKAMPEYDLAQEWNELYEYITSEGKNT